MTRELTVAEVCAGYGGLYQAVRSMYADAIMAWYAEIGKNACKVMERHHPRATNVGDITAIEDPGALPYVDVIVGGTPCQDLSVAGKGAGIAKGTRSAIVLDFLDIVTAIGPRMVLWENVGAARTRKGEQPGETVLGTVERRLREAGYEARSMSLKASDVGAPHRRDRVFVLGTKGAPEPDLLPRTRPNPHYLLPTPTVVDMGNNKTDVEWAAWTARMRAKHKNGNGHGRSLTQEAVYNAGAYADALEHWAGVSVRRKPPVRNRDGDISVRFVEWMMGLRSGHVTETLGLSRAAKLKLLGNGVVPQQAAAAIALMLHDSEDTL